MKFLSVLLCSLLTFNVCLATVCDDSVKSNVLDRIKMKNLIIDDKCKIRLTKIDVRSVHSGVDDNGVHSGVDDNGVHSGVDDNGVHTSVDDKGVHSGVDDKGVHSGVDDKGVHTSVDDKGNCDLILSTEVCSKVRAEHSDDCGLMTNDDCFNMIRNISNDLIEAAKKNSGSGVRAMKLLLPLVYFFIL